MLEILNIYAHGYVAIPVILACKKRGLFNLRPQNQPIEFSEIVNTLQANSGHLRVALRLMESLNWLEQVEPDRYVFLPDSAHHQQIPEDVLSLMAFQFDHYLQGEQKTGQLKPWFDRSAAHWGIDNSIMVDFVDGLLILPLFLELDNGKYLHNDSGAPFLAALSPAVQTEITEFFFSKGWLMEAGDSWKLNDGGRFMAEKVWNVATVLSYRPMLTDIDAVIFGDCGAVFATDEFNHERHVERTLNVIGSGFQHKKFFSDMQKSLIELFDTSDFASQPVYVADMGCGDGSLLRKIHDVITTKTRRGQVLDQYPLTLIGADYNEKALQQTRLTLEGCNFLTIQADIGNPAQFIVDLAAVGITDPENILHVRTFLDHDRPYIAPRNPPPDLSLSAIQKDAVYVDRAGAEIAPSDVYQSWVEHFGRWSQIIGKHGLLVLEVHYLKAKTSHRYIGGESVHFDAYHAFSRQMLVSAEAFVMAAAAVGLFPRDDSSRKYPKMLPFARVTMNYFERREFRIRNATLADLPAVWQLEQNCWPAPLQTAKATLENRIARYPDGQLVMELNGNVVGVFYSQKIISKDVIRGLSMDSVDICHHADGTVIQLLGVNISPQVQDLNLGDQLLEFGLKRAALMDDVHRVVGVTRPRNYRDHAHLSFEHYIQLKNEKGWFVDPILRFHQLHGADITEVMLNFRPADLVNHGYGAMVEYNLQTRKRPKGLPEAQKIADLALPVTPAAVLAPAQMPRFSESDISNKVFQAIAILMGEEHEILYSQPLMEMGLDSADLLELNQQLSQAFDLKLAPTFFFEYGTCGKVIEYIKANIGSMGASRPAATDAQTAAVAAPPQLLRPPRFSESEISDKVFQSIAILLGEEHEILYSQPLMEMGLDSADLLELNQQLSQAFELVLAPTFFFEYGTCGKVIEYIKANMSRIPSRPPHSQHYRQSASLDQSGGAAGLADDVAEIAIVGISCRLPGGGPDGFWQLLQEGVDGVRPVPKNRWWWPATDAQARRFEMAGYLDDIDTFDARFFRISAAEAELIDPQQRLLLELAWELFEDAGYDPESMRASNTGVWIGACHFDYRDMVAQSGAVSAHSATGTSGSILPNRLSYFFDFKGPSLLIDTACSSSLAALHDAMQSLRRGECQQAVVGGVNLICSPGNTRAYARAGMLSPTGRCHTFDRDADGYIRGEGAGLVLLKPLAQALADGDQIYGVVAGSAVNHGGEASSLTAPSPKAQSDVISRAYKDADLSPAAVDYVEAHGTGTTLGDPIELVALKDAFDGLLAQSSRKPAADWVCHVGSVKSNIGHLEGAAGVAGLIKILLSLRHSALPGNLHFNALNPHIDLAGSPFRMVAATRPWLRHQSGEPRCAGVSSFGFGGVSAHVLVREFIDVRSQAPAATAPQIIVLSARTDEQLRQSCVRLLAFLESRTNANAGNAALRLEDLAWTLQRGRAAMEGRLALVADSIDDLCRKLQRFLAGEKDERVHFASASAARLDDPIVSGEEGQDYLRALLERGDAGRVARLWVGGAAINWATLSAGLKHARISLPTYPFARERHWIGVGPIPVVGPAWIHPLLHQNTSDFLAQRFTTTLSGEEFFLSAHVLQGKRILPAVAYLEMARAAVASAAGVEPGDTIYLKDTVWLRPVVIEAEPVVIHIALSLNPDGEIAFGIYGTDALSGDEILYSQGRAGVMARADDTPAGQTAGAALQLDVEGIRRGCGANHIAAEALYARFRGAGFEYGAALQALTDVWHDGTGAVSKLVLPPGVVADAAAYMLHPSLMDASVQGSTVALNLVANGHEFAMPYAIELLEAWHPCTATMWAVCHRSQGSGAAVQKLDIDLCDESGRVCVRIKGLSVRATSLASRDATTLLWQRVWRECAANAGFPRPDQGQKRVFLFESGDIAASEVAQLSGSHCVGMGADGSGQLAGRYQDHAQTLWTELHALLEQQPGAPMLVQIVVPGSGDGAVLAGLAGLLKTVRIEHPKLVGQVIQIEHGETAQGLAAKLAECAALPQATQLRYVQGKLWEETWEELPQTDTAVSGTAIDKNPWREKGVYLITGGLGGLGLIFASEIVQQAPGGVLVLTGRTPIDDVKRRHLAQLAVSGTRIEYRQADVADAAQVTKLLHEIKQEFGGLHGIIHGAGVIRDGLFVTKKTPQLDLVFAPKVAGLINLDSASLDLDLDWIVCLGSTSGALGNVGQADYAAANAFMDRYANYRNATRVGLGKHRILSIDWPLWEDGGMQVDAAAQRRLLSQGIHVLPTRAGLEAFYQATASGSDQVLVLHGAPERLRLSMARSSIEPAANPALDAAIAAIAAGNPALQNTAIPDHLASGRDALLRMLRNKVSRLLRTPADNLDDDLELSQYGLDSISLTELTAQLNNRLGIALSPTFFFEHLTLRSVLECLLADYGPAVVKALGGAAASASGSSNAAPGPVAAADTSGNALSAALSDTLAGAVRMSTHERLRRMREAITPIRLPSAIGTVSDEPIAIVGMSGRYPQAWDLDAFWQNLRDGRDCVTEVPASRWDWRTYYSLDRTEEGRHYSKWGGFIDGVDEFDALFFNISPREARYIDPQERLFLQHAWMAMEDAGYTRAGLQVAHAGELAGQVGVYAGVMYSEYQLFGAESAAGLPIFGSLASIANRVSYALNLHGPSMTLDTMCSSSLTAIHLACQDLRHGRTDMAIAGGVNVTVHPQKYLMLSNGQFISSDGHCQSFGEGGDGYIPGEGVGIVILKRLSDAKQDGDRIHGVILGSSLNHGGKASGYTVPNPQAQTSAIARTLTEAKIDPRHISYVEAHGTGTKLGDPIEIAALSKAFGQHTRDKGFCRIGSAKSNIGHCESAAGMAGLMKVLLQMRHGQIVPSLHASKLNPHIDFGQTPFVLNQSLTDWTRMVIDGKEIERTAGLSSFGAGGSNAHMIVQEYREPHHAGQALPSGPVAEAVVIPLSARTPEQLLQKAADLLAWLERNPKAELAAIGYTLQIGRETMDERLGLLVDSVEQLRQRLQALVQGETNIDDLYRGQAKRNREGMGLISSDEDMKEAIDKWIARKKYGKLLELWVKGLDLDWRKLYAQGVPPKRIGLPSYPFARERHWVEVTPAKTSAQTAILHPLLHANTSDLAGQSYSSWFDGQELFLAHHLINLGRLGSRKVLPAVAGLEMARKAIELALPPAPAGCCLELSATVWLQPIIVEGRSQVSIALQEADGDEVEYDILSFGPDGEELIHCQGRGAYVANVANVAPLDIAQLEQQMQNGVLSGEALYSQLWQMGLEYGAAHRAVQALARGDGQVLARLQLPVDAAGDAQDYVLHPSMMDGALQACVGLMLPQDGQAAQTLLPYALESVRILRPCTRQMLAWVRYAPGSGNMVKKLDIDLCDEQGQICVQLRGLNARAVDSSQFDGAGATAAALASASGPLWARPVWQALPPESASATQGAAQRQVWLFGLPQVAAPSLEAALQAAGQNARCQRLGSAQAGLAQSYIHDASACFGQIQALLGSKAQGRVQVTLIVADEAEPSLWAGLAGLLRTANLENPQLAGQVVLVAPDLDTAALVRVLQSEAGSSHSALLRHRDGQREALVWQEQPWQAAAWPTVFKDDGVYLISGGMGGLGQLFAREIMQQTNQAQVILTGRGAIDAANQAQLHALSQAGRVHYRQLDLNDAPAVQALIDGICKEHGRLDGIIHSAGQVADNFILRKTVDEFCAVLGPKVAGTVNLDLASRQLDLDFMVLFSSIAAALGNIGQADYACGNGFMDQYAGYRNHLVAKGERQGRTVSINWPLWQQGGMTMDAASQAWLQSSTGLQALPTDAGLQAFYGALMPGQGQEQGQGPGQDQVLVLQGERQRLQRMLAQGSMAAIAQESSVQESSVPAAAAPGGLPQTPSHAANLEESAQDYLRRKLSSVLHLSPGRIDIHAALETYGIDSVLTMSFTRELEKGFGPLSKTLLFEYRTLAELALYFVQEHAARLGEMFAQAAPPAAASVQAAPPTQTAQALFASRAPCKPQTGRRRRAAHAAAHAPANVHDEPIAIIGLSARYPQARDLDAFWRNLRDGIDCVTEVPPERWDWSRYYSTDRTEEGRHYSKWGGFIEGVDEFDPMFFNISPREAHSIDPQERMFLQHAWMAMEDAGYTRAGMQLAHTDDLPGQVGVYAGVMYGEYQMFGAEAALAGQSLPIAGSLASIANRVSYTLNLHGPSMTLDTMCSSSLTAIHLACQDLKQGRTDMAIAGGVNLSVHPQKYLMLSSGQFISGDGHCQSFGEGGDGYIPGEGVGIVVLKRLSEAKRDGDRIHGVILGSALNHGGKTNGYTVPNPQAQAAAISRALADAKVNPRHISYVEAHGTGTKLGDPIEIAALGKVFGQSTQDKGFCRIGSAKSNIGHCESAAGIAGLMKVLLQMRHGKIVPSLHSARLNPHIDFDKTPFIVNQSLIDWARPVLDGKEYNRIAGLSSFGAGGSNAHMIVQEYREDGNRLGLQTANAAQTPLIFVLSARTTEQLRQKADDLLAYLDQHEGGAELADLAAIAYTLQVGREAMDERLALLADSAPQLQQRLQAFLRDEADVEDLYRGQARRNRQGMGLISQDEDMKEAIDKWIARRKYGKLLDLWAQGLDLDWNKLYAQDARPQRIGLPAYPFARDKYWVEVQPVGQRNPPAAVLPPPSQPASQQLLPQLLHPLLHTNTSSLNEHSYGSQFDGREFFLADHHVRLGSRGRCQVLPAVAYLEMAREAIRQALPEAPAGSPVELRHMVWAPPVSIDRSQVRIALRANSEGGIEYEVFSSGDGGGEQIHCQGCGIPGSGTSVATMAPLSLALAELEQGMHKGWLAGETLYARLWQMGLEYGPAHRALEALACGDGQVLAKLQLPPQAQTGAQNYVLHPAMMDGALQACIGLMLVQDGNLNQTPLVYSMESVRIMGSCTTRMLAWVRLADGQNQHQAQEGGGAAFDIDLCDPSGKVCVQISRLRHQWQTLDEADRAPAPELTFASAGPATGASQPQRQAITSAQAPAASQPSAMHLSAPVQVALGQAEAPAQSMAPNPSVKKPSAIALTEPGRMAGAFPAAGAARLPSSFVRLAAPGAAQTPAGALVAHAVTLFEHGNGVFSLCVATPDGENRVSHAVQQQLLHALARIRSEPAAKVVMLLGTDSVFLRADSQCQDDGGLVDAIAAFPLPLIAVMQGDADGSGLLLATLCDFMIGNTDARYGFVAETASALPSAAQLAYLTERFGNLCAMDCLYLSGPMSGLEMATRYGTFPVLPPERVKTFAEELALRLAEKPLEALQLLKRHLGRDLTALAAALPAAKMLPRVARQPGDWQAPTGRFLSCRSEALPGRTDRGLLVTLRGSGAGTDILADMLAELCTLLAQVSTHGSHACVMLASESDGFLPGMIDSGMIDIGTILRLREQLLATSMPVIAILDRSAHGLAWFVAQHCDACVYAADGLYSADLANLPRGDANLAAMAATAFSQRLGSTLANEVLFANVALTGTALQAQSRTLTVATHATTHATTQTTTQADALRLASAWAGVPAPALAFWRKPLRQSVQNHAADFAHANPVSHVAAGPLALKTAVVTATVHEAGILVVKMEDRQARNMFSPELVDGLNEVFAHINTHPGYKVVLLTGYDNYFASGGTKENLLAIQAGQVRFTDNKIFELTLRCPIPVIAAMQGHGIGAGWALGMFADFPLFSERSEYVSPYMNYGFTPGAGATLVFPQKVGYDLARETLMTGRQYAGRELRERGINLPVLRQDQVMPAAMALAQKLACLPRTLLIDIKTQLAEPMRLALAETYRLELEMHAKTFVGRADTLHLIRERFTQAATTPAPATAAAAIPAMPATTARPDNTPGDSLAIQASLKTLLAQELQMPEEEIDNDIQFVDLGLDSVSGVTWVRKINERHGTAIEATQIYSHPTLIQLGNHVLQVLRAMAGNTASAAAKAQAPVGGGNQAGSGNPAGTGSVPASWSRKPEQSQTNAGASAGAGTQASAGAGTNNAADTAAVLVELKRLLAQELQIPAEEIDHDIQFVELGLDSVSGVTWVRKINEHYETTIEATQIYSYPTLTQLSVHVLQAIRKQRGETPHRASPMPAAMASNPASAGSVPASWTRNAGQAVSAPPAAESARVGLQPGFQTGFEAAVQPGLPLKSRRNRSAIQAAAPTVMRPAMAAPREPVGGAALSVPMPAPISASISAPMSAPVFAPRSAPPQNTVQAAQPAILLGHQSAPARPEPIAIIGMAGQFPQALDVDEFWNNIAAGKDCIIEVPPERWDINAYYQAGAAAPGKTNSRWMGALEEYDRFDPLFFNISPTEAESMDPQQRLFLQTCWNAIEHAGYNARTLSGSNCGVFAGCGVSDYHQGSAGQRLSAQGFTGGASSILAARISYFLNLQGPCLAIDTACSSSLVAIAHACDSLNAGNTSLALAGGVYIMAGPEMHIKTAQTGMLSAQGRCFSFDQRANGFVPGEAVATVLLKRLSDAERDGDTIYAVIRGWGVNQDGKTNGITAPNPEAQSNLQCDVYQRHHIDPAHIGLIEAHGTGTKLGDPIEVQALKNSFAKYTRNENYCALGSVKSNIGHCLTAAGVTGFIKLIQALRHRQLPPTIQFQTLNEHIVLGGSPFYINDSLRPWQNAPEYPRQAAISSFGFSGTNAHLVLEEYRAPLAARPAVQMLSQDGKLIVPLSAKTPEQLHQRVASLLAMLTDQPDQPNQAEQPDLLDLAYTLQAGRAPMEERVAFMADSIDTLVHKLRQFVQGAADADGTFSGQVAASRSQISLIAQDPDVRESLIATHLAKGQLGKLAQLWSKGLELDWNRFYGDVKPRRIALPVYPFANERYWNADVADPFGLGMADEKRRFLHPLVQVNVSDFSMQRYSATFTGDEAFLADHRVRMHDGTIQKVLPGVAFLEMARMAIADALRDQSGLPELCDTAWLQPVVVNVANGPTTVFISLAPGAEDQIGFRIHSQQEGIDVIHCQGRAVFGQQAPLPRLDLAALRAQLGTGERESGEIYATFESKGLFYGPAHRGIATLLADANQVLARLQLPSAMFAKPQQGAPWVLHPGMMDSALQAQLGLNADWQNLPDNPLVPFALESLRVVAPCSERMQVWLRRSPGSPVGGLASKVDIDLCDDDGAVCVRMRGFTCRALGKEAGSALPGSELGSEFGNDGGNEFDAQFYEKLIDQILTQDMSIDAAVKPG